MIPLSYLLSEVDNEAIRRLRLSLINTDAETCIDIAEEFFRHQNIDYAIITINIAGIKYPERNHIHRIYMNAYMIHKTALKANNWYAVLEIRHIGVEIEEIVKQYRTKFGLLDSANRCPTGRANPSVAEPGALILLNAAWDVLSDPVKREAYDKELVNLNEEFVDYASLSSYTYQHLVERF
ncbi:hypothetical protein Ddye_014609 [Dipteronia dyeriana]|uniref:J domain-containing protein n=1 Tax=Dipteronia dyeriana TaxID=168575 RepID=A0AAD9X8P5_9ROSI|nr:hypothetical protein Ddye_014609 [Dipteronia dyeriana]